MTINAPHEAPPVAPYPPAPPYGPGGYQVPHPYPPRARRRLPVALVVGVGVVGLVAGVGAGAYGLGRSSTHAPAAPAAAAPTSSAPAAPATLSPDAAQAQTCGVLKANYETVANAIDDRNKFNSAPWTDPGLLNSVNTLVAAATGLADKLEGSLVPESPANLRAAVTDYVAGLRALAISQRNHAKDMQLNGTAMLYNQVVDAPLHICGIPD